MKSRPKVNLAKPKAVHDEREEITQIINELMGDSLEKLKSELLVRICSDREI